MAATSAGGHRLFWGSPLDLSDLFWSANANDLFWSPALSMPTSPKFRAVRFSLVGRTQIHESPLTGSVQTLALSGDRWQATFELPKMDRAEAEAWMAFLAEQRGRQGRFYAPVPLSETPRGVATGTPKVNGAGQTGRILKTDGWAASTAGLLKVGDYFSVRTPTGWQQLHKIIEDIDSDSGGNAYLVFTPSLRESPPDNGTIITSDATCIMRLLTDEEAAWDIELAAHYGIVFSAIEEFA